MFTGTALLFTVQGQQGTGGGSMVFRLAYVGEDTDGDLVEDCFDTCPDVPNPLAEDNDDDVIGDACDPDDDNDGVPDVAANCPFTVNADEEDADVDGFGMPASSARRSRGDDLRR